MVWLVFDHAVFGGVKRSIVLLMTPEVVGEIHWGYRDSHLRLQPHRDAASAINKGPTTQ